MGGILRDAENTRAERLTTKKESVLTPDARAPDWVMRGSYFAL